MPNPKVAAAAVVAVGAVATTVVLPALSDDKPEERPATPGDEVVVIYPDALDRAPGAIVEDSNEPLTCMVNLDCLLQKIETVTAPAAAPATPVPHEIGPPPPATS